MLWLHWHCDVVPVLKVYSLTLTALIEQWLRIGQNESLAVSGRPKELSLLEAMVRTFG